MNLIDGFQGFNQNGILMILERPLVECYFQVRSNSKRLITVQVVRSIDYDG